MSEAIGEIFATPGEEHPFKALLKFGGAIYESGVMSEAEGKSLITKTFDLIEAGFKISAPGRPSECPTHNDCI